MQGPQGPCFLCHVPKGIVGSPWAISFSSGWIPLLSCFAGRDEKDGVRLRLSDEHLERLSELTPGALPGSAGKRNCLQEGPSERKEGYGSGLDAFSIFRRFRLLRKKNPHRTQSEAFRFSRRQQAEKPAKRPACCPESSSAPGMKASA